MGATADLTELRELDAEGSYDELIAGLAERIAADRRTFTDPWVKDWCGRRWRNLFITNAAADPDAVSTASKRLELPGTDLSIPSPASDERSDREKVADRFLVGADDEWRVEMPAPPEDPLERTTLVFCPGLIGTMLPLRAFERVFPALAGERGWRILNADTHPVRGCEANVEDLLAALERGEGLDPDLERIGPGEGEAPEEAFLLSYSKGAPDALALLVQRPELADRVRALICWGGAIGGSYLADNVYEQVKDLRMPEGAVGETIKAILKVVFPIVRMEKFTERLEEYDVAGAVGDLTTGVRDRFMTDHGEEIDALDVPIFNVTAATRAMEVPFFQVQGYLEIAKDDPQNDMQVTQDQARVRLPMATDLAVLHAHHWDISYDPFPVHTRLGSPNLDHRFPRKAAITTHFQFLAELGLIG